MAASWQETTKGGDASSATSASVATSASCAVGDLLVAVLGLRGGTNGQAVTPPAGWTMLQNPATTGQPGAGQFPTGSGTGTNGSAFIYYRTAPGVGVQSFSFTWGTGVVHTWMCHRVTGATGSLIELLGSGTATTATSLTTASITTTEASELILRHVFGSLASGSTAMTGSGLVWDAATTKIADQQGAGTSGLAWQSSSRETGPGTAGAVTGRSITLPNAPIASGTVTVGILAGGGGGGSAPTNSVAPVITTDGSPETGDAVTSDTGTWANSPTSYAYQWKRNGSNISGATTSTYVLVTADEGTSVTVTVTATNATGSTSASSAAITPSAAPPSPTPVNTVAPVISTDGTPEVGETVTCSTGTWDNSPTSYAYQWRRSGVSISGATTSSYTLVASDVGTGRVSCSVTATNSGGSATANAASISPILSGAAVRSVTRYRYT